MERQHWSSVMKVMQKDFMTAFFWSFYLMLVQADTSQNKKKAHNEKTNQNPKYSPAAGESLLFSPID